MRPQRASAAKLMTEFMTLLAREGGALGPDKLARGLQALVDFIPPRDTSRAGATSDLRRRVEMAIELGLDHVHPEGLARAFRVSRRYLDKVFESSGLTVSQCIRHRRLDRAAKLLLSQPDRSTIDVAPSVGFKDVAHFSRSFREAFGQSPSIWRHTHSDAGVRHLATARWRLSKPATRDDCESSHRTAI